MTYRAKRWLFWSPRILCILFTIYVTIFALDLLGEGKGFRDNIIVLLIHLIPTAIILLVLAISWKWEWIGGVLFPAVGIYFLLIYGWFQWVSYLIFCGALFLMGFLFLINWFYRKQLKL